jgi:lysophospholipase L1-like esterase
MRSMLLASILAGTLAGLCAATGEAPGLRVRSDGRLDVSSPPSGTVIRYTLDGTAPTRDSGEWLAPVDAPPGYTVNARAFAPDGAAVGDVATWSAAATATRTPSTLVPVTQNRDWRVYDWTARHAAAVALMTTRQPEIVMLGDSITHFWGGEPVGGRRTGAEEWDRFFAGRRVVNLGYGWDRTENVLWRLTHGELERVSPKVVVTMIGTNNVSINTVDEIAAGIEAICAEIHRRLPATKILLLAIFPRGATPDATRAKVTEINQRIARLDGQHGVTFLDIGAKFLAADGSIATDVMYDHLHPTAKGYAIWSAAMAPTLERLLR